MAEGAIARRRRQSAMLDALRRLWATALGILAAAAVVYVAVRVATDPAFEMGRASVTGVHRESEEDVLRAAALPSGQNVWLMDIGGAVARVESLPWVRSAAIEREWPNVVRIVVVERTPAGRINLPEGWTALVDDDLRVLAVGQLDEQDASLPLLDVQPTPVGAGSPGRDVRTPQLAETLETAAHLARLGVRILEVESRPATGIGFTTTNHLRVLFGTHDDFERKVALLAAISKRIADPAAVSYVDLRSAAAPTVAYR